MNLADARSAAIVALARMTHLFNKPLFDEWILVKIGSEQGAILAYNGPRESTYQKQFKSDIAPLRAEVEQRHLNVGDFEFVQSAHGPHFDACIRLGPAAYLFCNHTEKTMDDIRKDPLWLSAQKPFVDLAAKFRDDPLE